MGAAPESLSRQQRRVLHLLAAGYSTKQIAVRLRISPRTTQWHISGLMRTFEVGTRAALIHLATRAGHLRHAPLLRQSAPDR
jgi:DNA-binding CsgD family transcriptional regulator